MGNGKPTPPVMRVRNRRFRSDSGQWPVVEFDPHRSQIGDALPCAAVAFGEGAFMQSLVGQSPLEDTVGTHPPVSFPAPRSHVYFFAGNAQRQKMASAGPGLLPLLPVVPENTEILRGRWVSPYISIDGMC